MTSSALSFNRTHGPVQSLALLGLLALAVYLLSLGNGFAYDDVVIVRGDTRVTEFQLAAIFSKPYWTAPGFALYRPLVTFSFALDWAVSNGNAAWFHAVNALWHALATGALFALLRAWFKTGPALAGAALFAVHPVHVEAVANVVGRAELMAAALFLAACACWAHEWPRTRLRRAVLVALLYALALLCKESAATLPALLFLIDTARAGNRPGSMVPQIRARLAEYCVLATILAGALAIRTVLAGGAMPTQLDPIMDVSGTGGERVRTALQIWPHIVRLMLFPRELLADYGPRVLMPAEGWSGIALLGLIIATSFVLGGLLLWRRGQGLGALILLWVPVTVLPVANLLFPIGVLLAERTLYLPSVAVCIALALLFAHVQVTVPARMRLAWAGWFVVLMLCAWRVQTRTPDWDSTDSIMMAQRRDRPDSFRAEWHAARISRRIGNRQEAMQRYLRALAVWPYRERLVVEAAAYLSQQRAVSNALQVARFGTQRWPRNAQLQSLLAANALDAGDTVTARQALAAGLRLSPNDALLKRMSGALNPQKAIR